MTTKALDTAFRLEPSTIIHNHRLSDTLTNVFDKVEKVAKSCKDLTHDVNVSINAIKNRDVMFGRTVQTLNWTFWFCIVSAIFSAAGGIGAALCKREYKKTRAFFASLAVLGAILPLLSALIVFKVHASLLRFQPFVQKNGH